jgi:lipopolysaccharide/colanic/teichoic acid biosynthesis glycosyltransferase
MPLGPVTLAIMMSTILVFAGAYPRRRTPLDIGDSEGLLRGICYAGLLLIIFSVGTRNLPTTAVLAIACCTLALLVVERESVHILRRRLASRSPLARAAVTWRIGAGLSVTGEYDSSVEALYGEQSALSAVKRSVDIVGATVLLFLALPLLICVSILIKIDSPGPVLIRQRRIGSRGVPFYMWKFRSMYNEVARYARSPVSDSDPRLTRIGRALRRFSIDELPQLLNVVSGEMSLVGPRPEMPFIVKRYTQRERLRLNAVPGITGLWQISPARAEPIHHNLDLDLFYIANQNIFLDTAILLRTVTAVFRGIGAA